MKQICLVRGNEDETYPAFREQIMAAARTRVNVQGSTSVKVTLTEEPPPKISVIPFRRSKMAAISFYGQTDDVAKKMKKLKGFIGAYAVSEVIPVAYSDRPAKEQTPGVCLLTLFRKKPGLDNEAFLHRWFNGHTPLSLRIHPLWNYNRNQVIRLLSDNSHYYDGIVEEQFRKDSDLLNPIRFFGHPLVLPGRMLAVYRDTRSFLDYRTIEPYFAREYWLVKGDK